MATRRSSRLAAESEERGRAERPSGSRAVPASARVRRAPGPRAALAPRTATSALRRPLRTLGGHGAGAAGGSRSEAPAGIQERSPADTLRDGGDKLTLFSPQGGGGAGASLGLGGRSDEFRLSGDRSALRSDAAATPAWSGGRPSGAGDGVTGEKSIDSDAGELLSPQLLHDPLRARLLGFSTDGSPQAGGRDPRDQRIEELEARVAQLSRAGAASDGPSRKRAREEPDEDGAALGDAAAAAASRIRVLERQLEESEVRRRHDAERYQLKLNSAQGSIEKLEKKLKFVEDSEKADAEERSRLESQLLEVKHRARKEVLAAQSAERESRDRLAEAMQQLNELKQMGKQTEKMSSVAVAGAGEEAARLREQVTSLQEKLTDALRQAAEVPLLQAKLATQASASTPGGGTEGIGDLRREVNKLRGRVAEAQRAERRAVAEVRRLQKLQQNSELTGERLRAAEERVAEYESASRELARLRGETEAQRETTMLWVEDLRRALGTDLAAALPNGDATGKPDKGAAGKDGSGGGDDGEQADDEWVTRFFRGVCDIVYDLRRERAVVLDTSGKAESKASTATRKATEALKRVVELQREVDEAEERRALAEEARTRAERRVQFLTRERDSLNKLVESYDSNSWGTGAPAGGGDDAGADASAAQLAQLRESVSVKEARIAQVEESLASARERIRELEGKASSLTPNAVHARAKQRIAALEKRADALSTENGRLSEALSKAEKECAYLEARVGRGDFNRSTTKVLHLSMNPAKAAMREKEDKVRALPSLRRRRLVHVLTPATRNAAFLCTARGADRLAP